MAAGLVLDPARAGSSTASSRISCSSGTTCRRAGTRTSAGQHARIDMVGDGLFHLGCLLLVLVGVGLLVAARSTDPPAAGRRLTGRMLAGGAGSHEWGGSPRPARVSTERDSDEEAVTAVLARARGVFSLLGGCWPLVSLRSFEKVLGAHGR